MVSSYVGSEVQPEQWSDSEEPDNHTTDTEDCYGSVTPDDTQSIFHAEMEPQLPTEVEIPKLKFKRSSQKNSKSHRSTTNRKACWRWGWSFLTVVILSLRRRKRKRKATRQERPRIENQIAISRIINPSTSPSPSPHPPTHRYQYRYPNSYGTSYPLALKPKASPTIRTTSNGRLISGSKIANSATVRKRSCRSSIVGN